MVKLFLKIFLEKKDLLYKNKVGIACSVCGILLNLMQFIIKMTVGSISGSVAVVADAVHNLSDMGSSAVTLITFTFSEKRPGIIKDKMEHAAGLLIALLLLFTAVQTAKSSVMKIITPEPVVFSLFSVVMLIFSILVKFYMSFYYSRYGKKINSQTLKVTSIDCLCDSIATIIAAGAIVAAKYTSANIDGYGGLAVSAFILIAACKAAKDSLKGLF